MRETIKNALILCAITLIAGLLLGGVYELTKKPRQEQEEKTVKAAYTYIFEKADSFEEIEFDDEEIVKLLENKGITQKNVVIDKCVKALNENKEEIGCIISVTSKEGYGGNISFLVGVNTEKNIEGISILSINETAGLGLEAKNEKFLAQYIGKGRTEFVVNESDITKGNNIDAMSGATITTNAITKGVNCALSVANYILEEGGSDE